MSKERNEESEANLPIIPQRWCWATVEQLGEIVTGSTPSTQRADYYGGSVPFFKPTDLNAGYCVRDYSDSLSDLGVTQARLLPARTVLVTCIGATIGKTGFARVACATNQQINALVCPSNTALPEWCYWLFLSSWVQDQIKRNASATTLPILNKGKFQKLSLPVAPINEQRRIVAKIEELFSDLDAGVAALERIRVNLKRYRAAVLKAAVEGKLTEEWRAKHPKTEPASKLLERILCERRRKWEEDQLAKFTAAGKTPPKGWKEKYVEPAGFDSTDLPELPGSWCWASVEQLAGHDEYSITDGPFGSNLKTEHYTDNGPRVIRLQNIGDGVFQDDEAHISFEHFKFLRRHSVNTNDVLVAMLGEHLPRACLVPFNVPPAIVKADCVKITPHVEIIVPQYLAIALNARPTQMRASTKIAGVGRPRLNLEKLRPLSIPVPPLEEQKQLVAEIERCLSIVDEIEAQAEANLKRAVRLRQSILKRAFEGKLVPQDPTDEPADKLLERIRQERAANDSATPRTRRGRALKQ